MAYNRTKVIDDICKYIGDGMSKKDAALLAGIGETTLYQWIKENDKELSESGIILKEDEESGSFRSRIEAAELKYKYTLVALVTVNATKNGRLALEMLARKWPDEFGEKKKLEIVDPEAELKKALKAIDEHEPGKPNPSDGEEKPTELSE